MLEDPAAVHIVSPLLHVVENEVHFEVERIPFLQKSTEIVNAISHVIPDVFPPIDRVRTVFRVQILSEDLHLYDDRSTAQGATGNFFSKWGKEDGARERFLETMASSYHSCVHSEILLDEMDDIRQAKLHFVDEYHKYVPRDADDAIEPSHQIAPYDGIYFDVKDMSIALQLPENGGAVSRVHSNGLLGRRTRFGKDLCEIESLTPLIHRYR